MWPPHVPDVWQREDETDREDERETPERRQDASGESA
jgi:hypothetical protein